MMKPNSHTPGRRHRTSTSGFYHASENTLPERLMQIRSEKRCQERSLTLYDRRFGNRSPSKMDRKVMKNKSHRRRTLEVHRFTEVDQKEQYQMLIDQYKSNPNNLLFHNSQRNDLTGKRIANGANSSIIDLTDKSPETERNSGKDIQNKMKKDHVRKSLQELNRSNSKSPGSRVSPVKDSHSASYLKTPTSAKQEMNKDRKEWMLPSSAFLSKNFIPNLLKTYSHRERQRAREKLTVETRQRQIHEMVTEKEAKLAEILRSKLKLQEKKEPEFVELTTEMSEAINNALIPYPPQEVLADSFNISITREHMSTLFGLNWLNDEIINFYMELIVQRSKNSKNLPTIHAMNTFFYPKLSTQQYSSVRRWTKRVDIFSKDLVLFPIHLGVHWCLAVIDFKVKEIRYYDSMGGKNYVCLETLKNYLVNEHMDKKKTTYDTTDWKLIAMSSKLIPQQQNGSDCGVFTCKFAEYIAYQADFNFDQSKMVYFRRAIVWEILNKKLLR